MGDVVGKWKEHLLMLLEYHHSKAITGEATIEEEHLAQGIGRWQSAMTLSSVAMLIAASQRLLLVSIVYGTLRLESYLGSRCRVSIMPKGPYPYYCGAEAC